MQLRLWAAVVVVAFVAKEIEINVCVNASK